MERWRTIIVGVSLGVVALVLLWRIGVVREAKVQAPALQEVPSPTPWVTGPASESRSDPKRKRARMRGAASAADAETSSAVSVVAEAAVTTVPQGRATLIVTVLDRRNDSPVAGVRVEASRWESPDILASHDVPQTLARFGVMARSDGPGIIRFTDIPAPSRVWLRLGANGYESVDVGPAELPGDGATVRQVYFLSPRARVLGRVVERARRNPIAGARVWLTAETGEDPRINTATTAADGKFVLENVPAGRRYLFVRAPFSAPETVVDLSVLPGRDQDVGDVEVSTRGAVVFGRVLRGTSAQPVTSVSVELVPQPPADRGLVRTMTDAQGAFRFDGLANGAYTLNVPEYNYSRPVLLAPEEERELVVHLGGVTLRGHLRAEGKPVAGSLALTRGPHGMGPVRTAFAADDGAFALEGIEPGRWTVSLWGPGAAFATEVVTIPDVPLVEKDFSLATGKIVGRVVEATGLPVPNARVECSYLPEHPYAAFMTPRTVTARTDAQGYFELGPLPEGTFSVRAEHPTEGFGVSAPVAVPRAGKSPLAEIRLERARGATLRSVALSFETGAPIREAFLVLYDGAGRVARSTSRNDAGVAEVRGLAPGTYRLEVSASGYTSDVREVELRAEEVKTVESVLATAGAVRVWVEDALGQALEGVALRLEPLDPNSTEEPRRGTSEVGGLWVSRGLAPGAYRLSAEFPTGQRLSKTVEIRPREVTEVMLRAK